MCQFLLCVFLSFSSCVCSGILCLSPGTWACANALPFTWHLHLCKCCLQCAHTLPFTWHSGSCKHSPFHLVFALLQCCLQHAHTLPFTWHSRSCKHCLQRALLVSCLSPLLLAIHTSSHPSLGQQLTLAGTNYTASPKCPESRPLSRIFPPFQTPSHSLSHKVWLSKHNHHARWPQPQS